MKTKVIYTALILFVGVIAMGCSKSDYAEEPDPLDLKLSKQLSMLDNTKAMDNIQILSGNGGYYLVFPKQIYVDNLKVDYSESILKLNIDRERNIIVIERKLLNDKWVKGYFLLIDKKGQKRLIAVDNPVLGLYDFTELEKSFFDWPDFWQW